jgi:hypothetical protein
MLLMTRSTNGGMTSSQFKSQRHRAIWAGTVFVVEETLTEVER